MPRRRTVGGSFDASYNANLSDDDALEKGIALSKSYNQDQDIPEATLVEPINNTHEAHNYETHSFTNDPPAYDYQSSANSNLFNAADNDVQHQEFELDKKHNKDKEEKTSNSNSDNDEKLNLLNTLKKESDEKEKHKREQEAREKRDRERTQREIRDREAREREETNREKHEKEKRDRDHRNEHEKNERDRRSIENERRSLSAARSQLHTERKLYDTEKERRLRLISYNLIPTYSDLYYKNILENNINSLIKKELTKETTASKEKTDSEMINLVKTLIDKSIPKKKSAKKRSSKKKSAKKKSAKKKSAKKKSAKKRPIKKK
jgi:hypothetical protein